MKKTAKVLIIICMTTVALFLTTVISVGYWMMPADVPTHSDAIVVVSGGGDERLEKGVELFKLGYADYIVFSGDAIDPDSPSNAEVMRDIAMNLGIPSEQILIETESKTTYENALKTKQLLDELEINPTSLILVTSAYHQRRMYQNFKEVYEENDTIVFINQPADVPYWTPTGWWTNETGFTITAKEFIKVVWGKTTGNLAG